MASQTSLSEKQIRVWFTNYRYRDTPPESSCLSKIKHAINTKSIKNERSKESKCVAIKEATNYYLSRYFCVCDLGIAPIEEEPSKQSIEKRVKKFLASANYCTCEQTIANFMNK